MSKFGKAPKCPKCGKTVYFAERQQVLGQDWHKPCVKCESCNKKLEPGNFADREGKIYCKPCYNSAAGIKGYSGAGGALDSFKSFGQGESSLSSGSDHVDRQQAAAAAAAPAAASGPQKDHFCANCGTPAAGGNFCSSCGTSLVR
eukprot:TRINITY_DN1137_c0_g1_i1.p2 TRINITY_DN1137_c0_g1~~TRINITY_DN1137_c0_g1_i1.p2  ORF type:complete len:145 (+),score=41.61 TRINITY_DN1137_c0_g1_i1:20-454(+)